MSQPAQTDIDRAHARLAAAEARLSAWYAALAPIAGHVEQCRDDVRRLDPPALDRPVALTVSERLVLRYITHTTLTTHQIADTLGLTYPTVRNHRARAYRKLGVHSRAEAVAEVRRTGVLDRASRKA